MCAAYIIIYISYYVCARARAIFSIVKNFGRNLKMDRINEVWSLVYDEIKRENNESTFNLWFSDLILSELTETRAVLTAQTVFKRNIIRSSFQNKLEGYFEKIMGFKISVLVISKDEDILNDQIKEDNKAEEKQAPLKKDNEASFYFSANEEYTFDSFIEGNSNKLALAACIAVANHAGFDYNPLFIHGPSGLGKTHLLHAITNHIRSKNPNVNIIYVTSENFTTQLIESISNKTTEQFRNKFRNADLLMIDDIQFIAGRENTQEEIFHTFNALYEKGVQIVLTSDRPARDINPLETRLLTRFNWGITADINPPDFELRAAILSSKAKKKGTELPPDIINMLAENLTDNIRQLEGAIKKLCAIRILSDKPITIEVAREAISDIVKEKVSVNVTIEKVLEIVSKKYGVSEDEIRSKKKTNSVANARQIAMHVLRKTTELSLPKIGKIFNRDHSTVLSSINKVENEIKCNSLFEIEINELIKEIMSV